MLCCAHQLDMYLELKKVVMCSITKRVTQPQSTRPDAGMRSLFLTRMRLSTTAGDSDAVPASMMVRIADTPVTHWSNHPLMRYVLQQWTAMHVDST